jgi:hypothetical protein
MTVSQTDAFDPFGALAAGLSQVWREDVALSDKAGRAKPRQAHVRMPAVRERGQRNRQIPLTVGHQRCPLLALAGIADDWSMYWAPTGLMVSGSSMVAFA